jgi:uncharacterized integral membrane protein
MTEISDIPGEQTPEKKSGKSMAPQVVRLVGLLALCGVIAVFVVQNSQDVSVKFWFLTRHPPLIFVFLGCLLVGGLGGYIAGRRKGESKLRKRLRKKVEPEL